jgi:hypothetical protein
MFGRPPSVAICTAGMTQCKRALPRTRGAAPPAAGSCAPPAPLARSPFAAHPQPRAPNSSPPRAFTSSTSRRDQGLPGSSMRTCMWQYSRTASTSRRAQLACKLQAELRREHAPACPLPSTQLLLRLLREHPRANNFGGDVLPLVLGAAAERAAQAAAGTARRDTFGGLASPTSPSVTHRVRMMCYKPLLVGPYGPEGSKSTRLVM